MLRVGLTGGLGSGKSTAAAMFAEHGAHVLSADAIGRELMQPEQDVYQQIITRFGRGVELEGGGLDRMALAQLAFAGGRIEELNAIVHPAVIARQAELTNAIRVSHPSAVVIVESALIFETKYGGEAGWGHRFDRLILVSATEEIKIARFVQRSGTADRAALEQEAIRRLAQQISDEQKAGFCDYVLSNDGTLAELQWQVDQLWPLLTAQASSSELFQKG